MALAKRTDRNVLTQILVVVFFLVMIVDISTRVALLFREIPLQPSSPPASILLTSTERESISAGTEPERRVDPPRRAIIYNKPPKTVSTSLADLFTKQLGNVETYFTTHEGSNNYLMGLNSLTGTTVFVQHRQVSERMLKRLGRDRELVMVTSTRDPTERWMSSYRETFKKVQTEPTNWTHFERWLDIQNCAKLFTYHTGKLYDCDEWTKQDMLRESRDVVGGFDLVIDLDHLDQSALVANKLLGVDLTKIGYRNRKRLEEKEVMPEHLMPKLNHAIRYEALLHREMLIHLGLSFSTITGTNCFNDSIDDPSPCWVLGGTM